MAPVAEEGGLQLSRWNTIEVNPETLYAGMEGVFAGGDVVTGPGTVVEAMAHGKTVARMIQRYIEGRPVEREYSVTRPVMDVDVVELSDEEVANLRRPKMPEVPVVEREGNFREVQLGFTEEMAVAEARRCVRCDKEARG